MVYVFGVEDGVERAGVPTHLAQTFCFCIALAAGTIRTVVIR